MGAPLPGATSEDSLDFFACQLGNLDLLRRKFRQQFLLFRSGWRLHAVIGGLTEFAASVPGRFRRDRGPFAL